MALSPENEIILQQKGNEFIEKLNDMMDAHQPGRPNAEALDGFKADAKLLLFTYIQLYDELHYHITEKG